MSLAEPNILADVLEKGRKSTDTEQDYQELLQVEFAKLHKEYRSLENKRHGIAQRDGYIRKRTDTLMPREERDHADLQHEMYNATCKAHLRNADSMAANMKDALKTYDLYQQEIEKKIKQIKEIERHVDRITEKIIKQRFKMLALHGLSKTMAQREREVLIAEDKLYHYTCAFNLQIHENKRLRDEIMDFLMERERFFKMHNSIKRQIGRAKKKMLNIVQLAVQTYDNRDEAMSKVKALREREEKEVRQHGMEVQEFERTLHHDKSILEFIKTKLKSRPEFEDAGDRRIRMGSAKERELDVILKKYRRSFKRILKYSNTNSILDLVDKYKTLDSGNFETFKYTSNLNNECEVLREEIEVLKVNIEDVHAEMENRERDQRSSQKKLQMSIIKLQEQLQYLEKQRQENKSKHKNIFTTIGSALVLTDTNTMPIMRLLGNKEGINENNICMCFTQLDIKITEMKVERDRLKDLKVNSGNVNAFKSVMTKSTKQTSQGGPFVPKMMIFRGENVDDDDLKLFEQEPYYYDEMKEYVMQKMIDDRIIDPKHRIFTVSKSTQLSQSTAAASTASVMSRKTLVEKARQSEFEGETVWKKRKRNPFEDGPENPLTGKDQHMTIFERQAQYAVSNDPGKEIALTESVSMSEASQQPEARVLPDIEEEYPSSAPNEENPPSISEDEYPPFGAEE